MEIHLNEHFNEYVNSKIEEGVFSSVDDAILRGLQLLELEENQRAKEIELIRQALIEGENSGEAEEFDARAFILEMKADE